MPEDTEDQTVEAARTAAIFADLERRVHLAPEAPPQGFEPLAATPAQLEAFKLPPRPDASAAPHAFANWRRALTPPLTFLAPRPLRELFAVQPKQLMRRQNHRRGTARTQEASRNWSGPYVRCSLAETCVLVQGIWDVPNPYPPAATRSGGAWDDGDYHSSTWIGLDGHDATSISLPQIGTAQSVVAAKNVLTPTTGAWWQWWVKRDPLNRPIDILPGVFPVAPGDPIYAQIDVLSPTSVRFFLKHLGSGVVFPPFDVDAPSSADPARLIPENLKVEGRTAAWIVERPMKVGSNVLRPLADYGSVRFRDCTWRAVPAAQPGSAAGYRQLEDARLIRMADWTDRRQPGIFVSTAERQRDDGALVSYRGDGP